MTKLPVYYHVPKTAGTYALSVFFGMARVYSKQHNLWNDLNIDCEIVRHILVYDNRQICVARVIALDWKKTFCKDCNKLKPFDESGINFTCDIEALDEIIKQPNDTLQSFTLIIEPDGLRIWQRLESHFECKYELHRFTFLRDPLQRVLSAYNYLTSSKSSHESMHLRLKQENPIAFNDFHAYIKSFDHDCFLIRSLLNMIGRYEKTTLHERQYNEDLNENHLERTKAILSKFTLVDIKDVDQCIDKVFLDCYGFEYQNCDKTYFTNLNHNKGPVPKAFKIEPWVTQDFLKWDYELYNHFIKDH